MARTLVELADSLVDEFDVVELLTTLADSCVDMFEVGAAAVMVVEPDGDLRLVTTSSEAMRALELFELQSQQGPCLDCFRSGHPVLDHHLSPDDSRWPEFGPVAYAAGFRSVDAIPMRLRNHVIGALNLLRTGTSRLSDDDVLAARALADVATIAILQHKAARDAQVVNHQLQLALRDRALIEQATGMIAERQSIDVQRAFFRLRDHARHDDRLLSEVAAEIVAGTFTLQALKTPRT